MADTEPSILTLAVLVMTMTTLISAFDLGCSANPNELTFSVTNSEKTIESIQFKHKTPNPGDPWIQEQGCNFFEGNTLVCTNKDRAIRPQSFRIDLFFTDQTNTSKELWYYDCYRQHGVVMVNLTSIEWNEFTITWQHFNIDSIFMKEDIITINNTDTGRQVHRQGHNQKNAKVFTYSDAKPATNYTVCVRANFFSFLKGNSERDTKEKCIHLTTKDEPADKITKEEGTDLKTPLLAVGIGVLCLVLLCLLFIIYNKKCKHGGDHDYDMNKADALMAVENGDGANGGGDEMQVYKDEETGDKEEV